MTSSLVSIGSGDRHVLAVHGWFGSARGWGSLPEFLDRSTYTYAFMDLRGYGGRKQVAGEFTMEEAAADAIALADELGWDRFSVIGHSMGAKVAHQMLLQAPDRVDKLVGLNPVPANAVPMDEQGWELFSGAAGNAGNRAAIIDFTTGSKLTATFINHVVRHSLENSTEAAFAAYLQAWAKSDFSDKAQPDTSTPVKLIVGVNDPAAVRRRDGADLAGLLPRGRDDHPPRRRALPDVRVAGVARDLHRGVPGARLMAPDGTSPARPDTEVVFDPATYTVGVPFEALARLRRETPVAWVPEIPVLGWPEGPGFWLVLRHADVESVLRRPELFSSALGATQIRDPASCGGAELRPPDDAQHGPAGALPAAAAAQPVVHAAGGRQARGPHPRSRPGHLRPRVHRPARRMRLRQGRSRRPAAARPGRRARRARAGPLAAVRLVQPGDRLPGPRLRLLGRVRPGRGHGHGPRGPRRAAVARPRRADARPAYPRGDAGPVRLRPPARRGEAPPSGRRRDVDPAGPVGRGRRPGLGGRVREHVLAVRRGRQRDPAQRPARRVHRAARAPAGAGRAARRPGPAARSGRRDAALVDAGDDVPPDRGGRLPDRRPAHPFGRQGRGLLHLGQP